METADCAEMARRLHPKNAELTEANLAVDRWHDKWERLAFTRGSSGTTIWRQRAADLAHHLEGEGNLGESAELLDQPWVRDLPGEARP